MKIGILGKPRNGDDFTEAYGLVGLDYSKIEGFSRARYLNAAKPHCPCKLGMHY